MDRDMVNCLHYLYQWGQITPDQFKDEPFWCPHDTRNPLEGRGIVQGNGYAESSACPPASST